MRVLVGVGSCGFAVERLKPPMVGNSRSEATVKATIGSRVGGPNERHTFHILQRLLEAKNVSVIEDDCPNRTLLRKTLYGSTFGSIMHK